MTSPPLFVSVLFVVMLVASAAGILALFVSGVIAMFGQDEPKIEDDDEDDGRGGDEGFTPDPWGPTGNSDPLEQHEDELICQ